MRCIFAQRQDSSFGLPVPSDLGHASALAPPPTVKHQPFAEAPQFIKYAIPLLICSNDNLRSIASAALTKIRNAWHFENTARAVRLMAFGLYQAAPGKCGAVQSGAAALRGVSATV